MAGRYVKTLAEDEAMLAALEGEKAKKLPPRLHAGEGAHITS
jgi:hypothetical protein